MPAKEIILSLLWMLSAQAQSIHMSAGTIPLTDPQGVSWTPNTCTGSVQFNNPGTFTSPIYNTTAYTQTAGSPIVCGFSNLSGVYTILIHLIEAVKSFNAPQKRVFTISVNGNPALSNIDIFQRSGGIEIPYDVVTYATATPVGGITISFSQVKSSAMFAGIELIPIAQPGFPVLDETSQPIGIASSFGIAAGIGVICIPTVSTSGILFVQCNIDTAVVALNSNLQSANNPVNCVSSSNNGSAYTASCTPKFSFLQKGQVLNWFPDVTNAGSETLSIDSTGLDSLGNPTMKILTRSANPIPVGFLVAGTLYVIWNDGTNWRLTEDPPPVNVARWQCHSFGTYTNPDGSTTNWSCAGLQLVNLTLPDGTTRGPYAGIVADSQLSANGNWVSVPVSAPDQE